MKTRFVFLLLPEVHIMDLAGPDQALHEAIGYCADFEIAYCSLKNNNSTTSGLPIGKVPHFSEMVFQPGDYLMVPGANVAYLQSTAFKKESGLFEWLRKIHQEGVQICSICSGAFVLAESGLLDGLPCTTHFKKTADLQACYPKVKVIENILFTEQNGIYTSAGVASGIDLTLHIIEQRKGSHFAHLVARELVVYKRRNGHAEQQSDLLQFRQHIHNGIHKVQDWIIDNINTKTSLGGLAEIAGMSERNFTRNFKKEAGITVNEYVTLIRKEKINELLKNPDLSRFAIASQVGLQSERQLSRILNT